MKRLTLFIALFSILVPSAYAQEYVLGTGDLVEITVYQQKDLNTRARVTEAGTISFPLLGAVRIGGLTEQGAEQLLGRLLKERKIVQSPQVSLFVEEYRSRQVAILGKVGKPGKYPVTQSSTVLDIIALAGGISEDGSDKVLLTRGGKSTSIDTASVLRTGGAKKITVRHADVIYVPRMEVFFIYGEVRQPGEYPLRKSMTVMQALSVSGGLSDKGTDRGLKIKRRQGGKTVSVDVKLTDLLKPNDVVYVREGLF